VDVHSAAPGTVEEFVSDEVFRVNVASRNFTPGYFKKLDIEKRWDLCCIATPKKYKRLTELLDVIRSVFDEKDDFQVLLLCPTPKEFKSDGWDQEFFRKYEQEFTDAEKENIDLHTPRRTNDDIQPVPKDYLPYLYNSSKAFTLFTQEEGASKVISESLLCGTPVVVRSNLRGGGRDYLDDRNSEQFESLEEAKEIFIEISENHENHEFDPTYLREELAEPQSAQALESEFKSTFEEMEIPWKGEIEKQGLHSKLPGHVPTIPEQYRSHPGKGQLKSETAAYKYIDSLLGNHTGELKLWTHLTFPNKFLRIATKSIRLIDMKIPLPLYNITRNIYNNMRN
jgi:glycosyltransferase involved in cell wall biosynthesis